MAQDIRQLAVAGAVILSLAALLVSPAHGQQHVVFIDGHLAMNWMTPEATESNTIDIYILPDEQGLASFSTELLFSSGLTVLSADNLFLADQEPTISALPGGGTSVLYQPIEDGACSPPLTEPLHVARVLMRQEAFFCESFSARSVISPEPRIGVDIALCPEKDSAVSTSFSQATFYCPDAVQSSSWGMIKTGTP